jgi:hypothetical protein
MNDSIIRHLTPACLAAISGELEAADRNRAEDEFLDAVNTALIANVGEDEAHELTAHWMQNI